MLIDVKAPNGPSVLQTPEIAVPSLTSSHLQQQGIFDCDKLPADIERLPPVVDVTLRPDPYNLKNGLKSEEQLSSLRLKKRGKRLLIASYLKPIEDYATEAHIQEEADRLPVKIAVWGSLIANVSLCVLQLYAAISAISLSLLATGIDSVFDIGSNIVLFWLHRKAERLDTREWPVGGARLETIGNIVYGFLMASVNLVVVVESCRSIISRHTDSNSTNVFHLPSILSVSVALAVKLVLFVYCFSLRGSSSQVRVLWQDHRNDLWINAFGILMSTGGSKLRWYLDPMGAIIIGLGIIIAWLRTIYGEFTLLAGHSAPHEMLRLLIYKAATYHEGIEKISEVKAFHSGPEYFVEIGIVMDANTPLWKARDISRKFRNTIEDLPKVEKVFVYMEY